MPRHVQDDLYRLVHSLSRTEKGYIRKYWSRYSDEASLDYVVLFDVLDNMNSYSTSELKTRVAGYAWAQRLSAVKNYCMARVLEALRAYSASATPARTIAELLDEADILWERTLYDAGSKRAERAREMALNYDEFGLHLRAISWLKRYRQIVLERPAIEDDIDDLTAEQQRVFDRYQNSIDFEGIGNAMHHHLIKSTQGDADSRSWLDALPQHPLFTSPDKALTASAKLNFHLAMCAWFRLHKPDTTLALHHATELLDLRETYPDILNTRPHVRDQIMFTYLDCCIDDGRDDLFEALIDVYWKPTPPTQPSAHAIQHGYRAWALEVAFALQRHRHDRIFQRQRDIRTFFVENAENIPPQSRIVNIFSMIRVCRNAGKPDDAAYWLQQMLQQPSDVRPDLHAAVTIIELMDAADRGDLDFVRNRVRSLERSTKKSSANSAAMTAVVSYFRRLPDAHAPKVRQLTEETLTRLQQLTNVHVFDPVSQSGVYEWLDAHVSRSSSRRASSIPR